MQNLDEFDKKLLRLLQQNNKLTADEMGELVSLSTSAVQRRLKKLRNDRVIEADVSIISSLATGNNITCIVDVVLENGNSKSIERFKTDMLKCEEVMQC